MKEITLCGKGRCCPVAKIDGDTVTITDDYGGSVRLTTEQIKVLYGALGNK